MSLLFRILFVLSFPIISSAVMAAKPSSTVSLDCSSLNGKAVINEIKTKNNGVDGFIEIYLLDSVDINNWGIYIQDNLIFSLGSGQCTINETTVLDNQSTGATNTSWLAGTFIVCNTSLSPADDEVLLVDNLNLLSGGDTSVIDYLGYGNGNNFKPKWDVNSSCGTVITDHQASNSDIARIPDGTGTLADNGDDTTKGYSNNGVSPPAAVAASFNCVASGSDSVSGTLYTKLADLAFGFDVVALKEAVVPSDPNVLITDFSGTVNVELIDASTGDGSCASYSPLTGINQSLTFLATDLGRKSTASISSSKAYKNLKCRVSYDDGDPATTEIVECSTDSFAIRPSDFTITAQKSDDSTLNNVDHLDDPNEVSGAEFKIIATTNIVNYDGMPIIDVTKITEHTGAVRAGIIVGDFTAAESTTGNSTGIFTYSEVGNFTVDSGAVVDSLYTLIDQFTDCIENSASNTADVNGKFGCNISNSDVSHSIGRFIPDYFEVTASTDGTFSNACAVGGFSYVGQNFTYNTAPSLTVTAYTLGGGVTQNYTGDYNNLVVNDFVIANPTTDKIQLGVDGSTKINLTWDPDAIPILLDNGNGTLQFTFGADEYTYAHETNSVIAPFIPELELNFTDITDSDGVATKQGSPLVPLSTISPYVLTPTGSELRFGRLVIDNAYGSELIALAVPVYTEYFDGVSFVANSDDSCTQLSLTHFAYTGTLSVPTDSTATIANVPFVGGEAGVSFSASNQTGYIDISVPGLTSNFSWLNFDWDNDGNYDDGPEGRATFGIYKGHQIQIFFREVY
ncbi:MAG: hypothetical protein HRT92_02595 [Piscirickettsiaceae bacterium]|nr:hypothetical protein [Piscirickettsiaceae bacterium]